MKIDTNSKNKKSVNYTISQTINRDNAYFTINNSAIFFGDFQYSVLQMTITYTNSTTETITFSLTSSIVAIFDKLDETFKIIKNDGTENFSRNNVASLYLRIDRYSGNTTQQIIEVI